MSAARIASAVVLALGLSGCFRLTDPIYHFKSLGTPELKGDRVGLVIGTLQIQGGLFTPSSVDSIYLRRLAPKSDRGPYWYVSESVLFRVLQRRSMKDGTFVFELPPGTYELDAIDSSNWIGSDTRWRVLDDAAAASRFSVTRPGVYDLGVIRVDASFWGSASVSFQGVPKGDADRQSLVTSIVQGSPWEGFLKPTATASDRE